MHLWQLRSAANWLNLTTPAGLALVHVVGARSRPGERGTHVATHFPYRYPRAAAFTVGSVIVTRHSRRWLLDRPRLLAHEENHAWQYAVCGGVPFIPLYLLATGYSLWRTGDRARDNVFERLAGLEDGGYAPPVSARERRPDRR